MVINLKTLLTNIQNNGGKLNLTFLETGDNVEFSIVSGDPVIKADKKLMIRFAEMSFEEIFERCE